MIFRLPQCEANHAMLAIAVELLEITVHARARAGANALNATAGG